MPGSWTSPATFTPGQIITDSILNANLRDNMLWLAGTDGIVAQCVSQTASTVESTTSSGAVELVAPQVSITTGATAAPVLLIGTLCVANNTVGSNNYFYFGVNHVAQGPFGRFTGAVSNALEQVTIQLRWSLTSSATTVISLFWSTSAGTLVTDSSCVRGITAIELRR